MSIAKTTDTNNTSKPLLWLILALYIIIAGYSILQHKPWGDELHSWNIAKNSGSYFNLISNIKYEGHPPFWYSIMWCISKCTHHFVWIQMFHLAIASSVIFVILFYAPFSTLHKILLPFSYYFIFEYAVISGNYAMGVLAAFLICIVIQNNFKYKNLVYYLLLLLMSNSHLLSAILAGCLHLYFLMEQYDQKIKRKTLLLHVIIGALIFMVALYFIWPPIDSELGSTHWIQRWNMSQVAMDVQAPLRAFVPMPAWWKLNFWNQQFLLELHTGYNSLRFAYPLLSISLIALACYTLKESKKALVLFIVNLLLTFLIGNVLVLYTQRHTGYIFISFLVALWLSRKEKSLQNNIPWFLNGILILQMIAGIFAIVKNDTVPFSNFYCVNELLKEVPANKKVVTDYWTLIGVTAYSEKPIFSIDMQETVAFSLWKNDMLKMRLTPYRYYNGVSNLFNKERIKTVYLLSSSEPKLLAEIDSKLFSAFEVHLVDAREGAIEKSSNLYLYQISSLQ